MIAERLIDEMIRAASIVDERVRTIYDVITGVDADERLRTVILQRKITRERVEGVINRAIGEDILLVSRQRVELTDSTLGSTMMKLKLSRGSVHSDNVDFLSDCKYSAEALVVELRNRQGRGFADKLLQDLSLRVRTEWLESFDEISRTESEPFGQKLLELIRPRIRKSHENLPESLARYCRYQHLLGVLGILTEHCLVKWSNVPLEAQPD